MTKEKSKKNKKRKKQKEEECNQCIEYLNLAKRAMADYENLKKETEDWKSEFVKFANGRILNELLPVLDNFNEAISHVPEKNRKDSWVVGIEYIKKQLEDVLRSNGVESYGEVGDKFDPNLHEALEEVKDKKLKSGTVARVVRKGYRIDGKILRHAKVIVAK